MMASQREQQELAVGILIGRIRGLQAAYDQAHEALTNWGHWSADRRGIFPTLKPPSVWDQFKHDERDDYGEEQPASVSAEKQKPKPEGIPKPEYSERQAVSLDERIHHPGGLGIEMRYALRAAYVTREVPEHQFPKMAGCSDDAFCERLEACLLFVGRFVGEL